MGKEFKCVMCKGVFNKEQTDEDAEDELKRNFPGFDKEDCEIVCDDCYKKIHKDIGKKII